MLACGTSWHAALVGKFLIEQLAACRSRSTTAPSSATAIRSSAPDDAGRRDHPVRRDRRHAGGAARGARPRARAASRSATSSAAMATREADGTRLHPRRPGDRRRVDQGVHHAAGRAATCSRSTWRRLRGTLDAPRRARSTSTSCSQLPQLIEQALKRERADRGARARASTSARDFLYLGRGINYPIALEGALKLKEISYIHAEGYPAGEMKHGPIALIDEKHAGGGDRAARRRASRRCSATSRRSRRAAAGHRASPRTATTRSTRSSIRARRRRSRCPTRRRC